MSRESLTARPKEKLQGPEQVRLVRFPNGGWSVTSDPHLRHMGEAAAPIGAYSDKDTLLEGLAAILD